MALSRQKGDMTNDHAFKKCIENAQTLATLLQDCQRQRSFYFSESMRAYNKLNLSESNQKIMNLRSIFQDFKTSITESFNNHSKIQDKLLKRIVARYDKDFTIMQLGEALQK